MNKTQIETIVKSILSNIKEDNQVNIASIIADELAQIEIIKKEKFDIQQSILKIRNKADEDVRSLQKQFTNLQTRCKHHLFSFYPDASGGNDSCHICDICGKEW